MKTLRPYLLAAMLAGACGAVTAQDTPARAIAFKIAAQPLDHALKAFAGQSGLQVLFHVERVAIPAGLTSPAVEGKFKPEDVLKQLLANSGLRYEFINARTVTIRSAQDGTASPVGRNETSQNGGFFLNTVVDSISLAKLDASVSVVADADVGAGEKSKVSGSSDVEEMIVEEKLIKPFADRNADLPRTINDEQPYYIFDTKTIERSGSASIEDFLKNRLTMNAAGLTNSQTPVTGSGNASSINLRGLGADKTLILVNGRRIAARSSQGSDTQSDLNGIPLTAIDRIEVLPASASGIYGGSAIGGVVNVVLKKDYSGGEVRLSYDNTWDTDAPTRRAAATFGQSLEGGKTNFMVTAQWSDAQPLLLVDRRHLLDRGFSRILANSPSSIYSATSPFLGAAPNITASTAAVTALVLRDGRTLSSRNTTVPVGTAPGTSLSAISDALLLNANRWNLDLPLTAQSPTGLLRPLGSTPSNQALMATMRRQFGGKVEAFMEMGYQSNHTDSISAATASVTVPVWTASAPSANPFTTPVVVRIPSTDDTPFTTDSVNRSLVAGVNINLPSNWIGVLEYSWSDNRSRYTTRTTDSAALNIDLANGTLNPFVDTLLYPLDLAKYKVPGKNFGSSTLNTVALRGSGPLPSLPWGEPTLTMGFEHRVALSPQGVFQYRYAITVAEDLNQYYFSREQLTDSVYAEMQIPLVARGVTPLLHGLDLQFSGRSERYVVDAGTPIQNEYPNNPSRNFYFSPTLNGQAFRAKASYASKNSTIGLKYQPLEAVIVRASLATAFLPPTPSQLTPDPTRTVAQIIDPKSGVTVPDVEVTGGGNPNLQPQNSKSLNVGLIFEPQWLRTHGLRLNAEYYRIKQFEQISSLGAQALVNNESIYGERIVRNGSGRIVAIDNSLLNLYGLETEGWDLSVDRRLATSLGTFNFRATQTYIMHEQRQFNLSAPMLDYAGYVGEGGPAKLKGNANVTWEHKQWIASWTAYYFGSYKQSGAAGGPSSLRSTTNPGGIVGTLIAVQGSQSIPAQLYHDFFGSYSFGKRTGGKTSGSSRFAKQLLDGLTLQVGVKNLLNTIPPFDASMSGSYYISPYGDKKLRTYWINAMKQF